MNVVFPSLSLSLSAFLSAFSISRANMFLPIFGVQTAVSWVAGSHFDIKFQIWQISNQFQSSFFFSLTTLSLRSSVNPPCCTFPTGILSDTLREGHEFYRVSDLPNSNFRPLGFWVTSWEKVMSFLEFPIDRKAEKKCLFSYFLWAVTVPGARGPCKNMTRRTTKTRRINIE